MTLPSTLLYPKPDFPLEKVCTKCGGDPQPLENFHKAKKGKYGRQSHCKKCTSEYHDKWAESRKLLAQSSGAPESKVCTNSDCTLCGTLQPIEHFSKDCSTKDGYRNWCKTCDHARDNKYRKENTEKRKANCKKWYENNKEYAKKQSQKWRDENPEQAKETKLVYHATHKEQERASQNECIRKNPDKYRASKARRRANKRGCEINDFTAQQWIDMQKMYDHRCFYCKHKFKGRLTQDHVVPLIKGGNHTLSNIIPACKSCNSKKHTGPPLCPVQPLLLTW